MNLAPLMEKVDIVCIEAFDCDIGCVLRNFVDLGFNSSPIEVVLPIKR